MLLSNLRPAPFFLTFLVFFTFFAHVPRAEAAMLRASEVTVWKGDAKQFSRDVLFTRGAIVGSVAFGDLGKDVIDEIVVGTGVGMAPLVSVQRADGSRLFQFTPFLKTARQGVNVALGDIDGDGVREILTSQAFGGNPNISIFTNLGKAKLKSATDTPVVQQFEAYPIEHTSGVSLAAGDVDGDGKDEIITAEGPFGTREVHVYRGDGVLLHAFNVFDEAQEGHGVHVAVVDANADGKDDVVVSEASQGSRIQVWDLGNTSKPLADFSAFESGYIGGVRISAGIVEGKPRIVTSVAGAGAPIVKVFSVDGDMILQKRVYETTYDGGVLAAYGRGKGGVSLLLTAPTSPTYYPGYKPGKSIEVSLNEQRLYAWQNNYLMRTFLISSGLAATPSPVGEFAIKKKALFVNYTRIYGPGDVRNYSYPNTKWNLMFKDRYYIHTAYWHNNFGRPMSHGCVNTATEDAEWTYKWADMGTPVKIAPTLTSPMSTVAAR